MNEEEQLKIAYMPLSELRLLDGNPKQHDIGKIVQSIERYGYKDPARWEPTLNDGKGGIVEGNGRTEALLWMREGKFDAPRGIVDKDGEWYVPILVGVDAADALEAKAYAIDHNNLSLMGGDLTALDMATMYDREAYLEMLVELAQGGEQVFSVDGDDLDLLISSSGTPTYDGLDKDGDRKPNPRQLPVDFIYTWNAPDASCCLAVKAGFLYGIQSARHTVERPRTCGNMSVFRELHNVQFVDNDYFKYDHEHHVAIVEKFKPKYATVMDVMTRAQCEKAGIEYAPLEQVLDWAEEVGQYAQNVIVIPKYDCIDEIPEKFMLGYSVPTSHGGTPLPPEMFLGRRVHLLGGSWKSQRPR